MYQDEDDGLEQDGMFLDEEDEDGTVTVTDEYEGDVEFKCPFCNKRARYWFWNIGILIMCSEFFLTEAQTLFWWIFKTFAARYLANF